VTAVDRATGNRTLLADHDVGRGPMMSYGFIDIAPDGIVWLSGDAGYSLGALDPLTGDRVVAAK
jgi:streptogramin lyase